jgi:hypothetical protein
VDALSLIQRHYHSGTIESWVCCTWVNWTPSPRLRTTGSAPYRRPRQWSRASPRTPTTSTDMSYISWVHGTRPPDARPPPLLLGAWPALLVTPPARFRSSPTSSASWTSSPGCLTGQLASCVLDGFRLPTGLRGLSQALESAVRRVHESKQCPGRGRRPSVRVRITSLPPFLRF